MRMLAYDSGITLFTIDELIPYAVASLLLCIAYFIGVYFGYYRRIKQFLKMQVEYKYQGETRLTVFWGFLVVLLLAYIYVCFIEPDIFHWIYVFIFSIIFVLYITTGIIIIGEFEMFIDGTIIKLDEISKIEMYYTPKMRPVMQIIKTDGKKIGKRAPGRTRKFLTGHLNDVWVINNVDFR